MLHQVPGSLIKYEARLKRRKFNNIDRAILDFTKAIQLTPTNYMLYLYRGRLLLKQWYKYTLNKFKHLVEHNRL